MLRNDYRRALIMFRSLEQGFSGHARLERRTLMGTLCLTACAPGALALRAALVGRRGNDYFAAPLGTLRRDSRGQHSLIASFDPRNIEGRELEEYQLLVVVDAGDPCHLVLSGNVCGSVQMDWERVRRAACALFLPGANARAGIMETTMHDETETDLFGEQTVLCGGVVDLMRCGFEVLVEAGYEPENAYFECIHEMKLIVDLINKGGVAAMNYSISDTAEFGEYVSGPRVLPAEQVKANMRAVLQDIQDGTFAGKWIAENKNGRCFFNSKREALAKHPMEVVGKRLREQMLWKNDSNLDNASN